MAYFARREPGGSFQTSVMDSSPPRAWRAAGVGAGRDKFSDAYYDNSNVATQ